MPKVSVIVPCFNYARYLEACLKSVLEQQGFSDFEILLIDDASTDAPEEVVERLRDPRIRLFHHPYNVGHLVTVREGFRRATGRYLVRLDADDFWHPDFLKTTVSVLDRNPEVGLVHTHYALADAEGRTSAERARVLPFQDGFKGSPLPALLLMDPYLPPVVCLFRRECLGNFEMFLEEAVPYSEDWQLCLKIALRHPFYFVDHILAFYRVHENNLHVPLARAGKAEFSEVRILEQLFSDPEFPDEFRVYQRRAYAACYRRLADQYFGFGNHRDCRRCLVSAACYHPQGLFSASFWKRWVSACIPRTLYPKGKTLLRRLRREVP